MIVYQLTNKVNGDFYIGITTKSMDRRFFMHKWQTKNGRRYKINNALLKYGFDNFEMNKLYEAKTRKELINKEMELIEKMKPAYNISPGGTITFNGRKHTEEFKRKLSKRMSGKNNPMYGKNAWVNRDGMSEQGKENIRQVALKRKKVKCNHCDIVATKQNIIKWHNDNCRERGIAS